VIGWSRWFAPHVRSHAWSLAGLAALGCVAVALEALLPWPLKLIVDHVLTGMPLPEGLAALGRLPGADRPEGLVGWLALALVVTFVAAQAIKVGQSVAQTRVGARLQYALAAEVFAKLHALSLVAHYRGRTGDLVRRVTHDTACLPGLVTSVALPVFTSCLSLVVLFAIMWQLDPMMAIVAAVAAVPMGILMRVLGPRMSDRAYEHQQVEGQVWSVAEQTLTALPLVQAFGRERHEHARFRSTAERSIGAAVRALVSQVQFKVGVDGSLALGTAVIMLVGGVQALDGELSAGTLIVFLSYLAALYAPLLAFAYLGPMLATAVGGARRVAELLEHQAVVAEMPGAKALAPGRGGAHLRFEDVVFGYSPGSPVLHGIDFEVQPGETVAIVGATGAGKSTLAAMIPRLMDPWEGRVLIDGQDVRQATIESVRRGTALVLQETFARRSARRADARDGRADERARCRVGTSGSRCAPPPHGRPHLCRDCPSPVDRAGCRSDRRARARPRSRSRRARRTAAERTSLSKPASCARRRRDCAKRTRLTRCQAAEPPSHGARGRRCITTPLLACYLLVPERQSPSVRRAAVCGILF
jgi:ATP-binding cassette subfamily B protein/subfamily B ATP-binding cassette protein MsbA